MAFTKKEVDARKEWLTQGMLERRERRAAGKLGKLTNLSHKCVVFTIKQKADIYVSVGKFK